MRWIVVLLSLLLLATACGGSSPIAIPSPSPPPSPSPIPSPSPTPEPTSFQQEAYNLWLTFHRDQIAENLEFAGFLCDPSNWDLIAEDVSEDAEPILFRLALIDACHEAGQIPGLLEWSDYYAAAIKP